MPSFKENNVDYEIITSNLGDEKGKHFICKVAKNQLTNKLLRSLKDIEVSMRCEREYESESITPTLLNQ